MSTRCFQKMKLVDSALHVLIIRMSAKQGIKEFGEEAVPAMFKEYKQNDTLKVVGCLGRID